MTFITNTITNANPGPTLYTPIETAMLADGWTLVDTVTIGGNTHKVLKSAAAGNVQGLDWYLDINFPTTGTTGGIRFCPFETYDAAAHTAGGGPFWQSSTTIDATNYNRFGTTKSALETNWANVASNGLSTALSTAAFTYRISVTRNRIIVLLDNVPGAIAYAGFFTPSSAFASNAGAALFPLVVAVLNPSQATSYTNSNAGTACLTRLPKVSTMAGSGWAYHCAVATGSSAVGGWPEGQAGVAVSPLTGRTTGRPLTVAAQPGGSSSTGLSSQSSSVASVDDIGTIDDVINAYVSSGSVRGDSITIGSDTWYDVTPNSSATLFFRGI
jgi:hypothetical protein